VNGVTLTEWLREQLNADEQSIRTWASACVHIESCDEPGDFLDRFDEARVLAEIKAKRAIIAGYEASYRESDDYPGWEGAMYAIAQPYAGRDGWQDEWATPPT
jgi:hypothetical protein